MNHAVAVDIGGTKLAIGVVDSEGAICSKSKVPVQKESPEQSVRQIIDCVNRAIQEARITLGEIAGLGVAIPGVYSAATGAAWAPNLWGWDQVPLKSMLESEISMRLVIDSDRAAYVLGEQWHGRARGLNDVVFLAVGTGIGAGIITGGRLCRGAGDIAGAVGWFALRDEKQPLYRHMGCFEAEAAGPSLVRREVERIKAGEKSTLCERAGANPGSLTAEMVVAAARENDALARRVVEETAVWLGRGVANIISLLNPEMIVLGGGLMQAGDLMLDSIRREAFEWAQPLAAKQARIELAELGEDAGLFGAARLVFLQDLS